MNKVKLISGAALALTVLGTSCNMGNKQNNSESKMEQKETIVLLPTANKFVTSPIRNRLVLELNKPVSEVWATIGNPAKMPTYSAGLAKVELRSTTDGKCTEYTCYFKPIEEGGKETVHTAKMLWYESKKGWASLDNEPNEFGLKQSLTLITMEQQGEKTIVSWSMHFNCDTDKMIAMNKASLEQALFDIGNQLVRKFGGKIVENFVRK